MEVVDTRESMRVWKCENTSTNSSENQETTSHTNQILQKTTIIFIIIYIYIPYILNVIKMINYLSLTDKVVIFLVTYLIHQLWESIFIITSTCSPIFVLEFLWLV